MHRVYMRAFWPTLVFAGFLRLIGDLLAFVGPWCVEHVVAFAYKVTREQDNPVLSQSANQSSGVFSYHDNQGGNLTVALNQMNTTHVCILEFFLSLYMYKPKDNVTGAITSQRDYNLAEGQ